MQFVNAAEKPLDGGWENANMSADRCAGSCLSTYPVFARVGTRRSASNSTASAKRAGTSKLSPSARTSGERRLRLHLIDIDRATEADLLAGGAGDHASYPCRVMLLIRPWTDAGRARTRCSRSVGRTKPCNGSTTVGPETARITPIITAAPGDRPSSSAATAAASGQVISTPDDDQPDYGG
jgi:hypothetical protein